MSDAEDIEHLRGLALHLPAVLWVEAYAESAPSKAIPLYYSEGSERVTGYRQHEWFDDPELWLKIIHPEDQQRVVTETWEASLNDDDFTSEFRIPQARRAPRLRTRKGNDRPRPGECQGGLVRRDDGDRRARARGGRAAARAGEGGNRL